MRLFAHHSGILVTTVCTTNLGRAFCLGGASLGAIGLIGWLINVRALVTILPGEPPMMPNTALALLLLGLAAAFSDSEHAQGVIRLLSTAAAGVVFVIGIGTIAEYALDLPFSIDQLFVQTREGPYPGRPSTLTAVSITCLAATVLLRDVRSARKVPPREWLLLCTVLIALVALLGLAFGEGALYQLTRTPIVGVAVHSALGQLMIALGLFLQRPDAATLRFVTSPTPGGMLLRRLAPIAILIPVLFGLTAAWLLRRPGLEDYSLIFAALIVISSALSVLLLALTAERVNRAQYALEQNQRQTRDLINLASDGIFLADLEGRHVDVNESGCQMLGYTREEILEKHVSDIVAPDELPRLQDHKDKMLGGAVNVSDWNLVCKDGRLLPTEVSAKILPDGRWQAFIRDISARKRAEEKLRQVQERLDLALKGADLGLWDWNLVTGELIVNPRFPEMRGFRPGEIPSQVDAWFAGVHPDDLPPVQKALRDHFEKLLPEFEREFRMSTKDGNWIWVLSRGRVSSRDELGRPTRIVGTVLDITARKGAEDEVRRSEAAAWRATQARDDVLGIVAHDLRNPLSAIDTLAQVLRMKGLEVEVGDEIADAAHRMNRLIGDLLDVTSMEAGHLSLKQQRVPVAALITDAVEGQTTLASSASLELRLDTTRNLPDVWADRDRVIQVFENLIGNAFKFTKPGGRITLGATARGEDVMFSVSDTGRGIASTHLPHVFDRFWQAPGSERRGMGFGLAIVKGIVEAHGGRVWVRSSPGQGTTFFFTIATAAAQTAVAHAAQ